jgi:hypothetical protein
MPVVVKNSGLLFSILRFVDYMPFLTGTQDANSRDWGKWRGSADNFPFNIMFRLFILQFPNMSSQCFLRSALLFVEILFVSTKSFF